MVDEGMVVREALEAQSARYCAVSATLADIQRLMKLAEEVDARIEAGPFDEHTTELDQRFHLAVAEAAGFARLGEEIERWVVVMNWAELFIGRTRRGEGERHVEVVRAIATGDPDAADRQMRQHVLHPWQEMKWEVHETAAAKLAVG